MISYKYDEIKMITTKMITGYKWFQTNFGEKLV